jgi:D-inositol-3-phosphate glycosyltransferase
MQRIALISEHASPLAPPGGIDSGGQNIYVAHLARALAKRGYQVDVFTRRDNDALPPVLSWLPGVRVIHVPAGAPHYLCKEQLLPHMDEFTRYTLRFARFQRRRYDVVHGNFFMSGMVGKALARAEHAPLVMTFHALGLVRRQHQSEADLFPDSRFEIEADLVRCADRIIAECPQDHDDLCRLYGADPAKLDIVPCGYDPDEMRPVDRASTRRELSWDADAFSILQLGRLVPRKGIDNVIRALAVLRQQHGAAARLYIVGGNSEQADERSTPEVGRLSALADELGVREQVQFVGRRDRHELHRYYSAADVFVSTPWYEPFGITPVEAMACGLPVIGSNVGGIRSTVDDGRSGFLVPPEDPQALAQRLLELQRNPSLRDAMGASGRRRAQQHYTWQQVADGVAQVYRQALPTPLPRRRVNSASSSIASTNNALAVAGAGASY